MKNVVPARGVKDTVNKDGFRVSPNAFALSKRNVVLLETNVREPVRDTGG
jgi:hypothetical protein